MTASATEEASARPGSLSRLRSNPSSIVLRVLVAVMLVPFVVALVVLWTRPWWHPGGDEALISLRAWDVGRDTPLLGAYSRYGWNHPGPLLFWLLAVPVRLLGDAGTGATAGAIVINATASVSVVVLVARRIGTVGAAGAMGLMAGRGRQCRVLHPEPRRLRNRGRRARRGGPGARRRALVAGRPACPDPVRDRRGGRLVRRRRRAHGPRPRRPGGPHREHRDAARVVRRRRPGHPRPVRRRRAPEPPATPVGAVGRRPRGGGAPHRLHRTDERLVARGSRTGTRPHRCAGSRPSRPHGSAAVGSGGHRRVGRPQRHRRGDPAGLPVPLRVGPRRGRDALGHRPTGRRAGGGTPGGVAEARRRTSCRPPPGSRVWVAAVAVLGVLPVVVVALTLPGRSLPESATGRAVGVLEEAALAAVPPGATFSIGSDNPYTRVVEGLGLVLIEEGRSVVVGPEHVLAWGTFREGNPLEADVRLWVVSGTELMVDGAPPGWVELARVDPLDPEAAAEREALRRRLIEQAEGLGRPDLVGLLNGGPWPLLAADGTGLDPADVERYVQLARRGQPTALFVGEEQVG